jgi:hypothetical protein
MGIWIIPALSLFELTLASQWKMFEKAGKPGWTALVPFYNCWVVLSIVGRPRRWLALLLLPAVAYVVLAFDLARSFGRSAAFATGLVLLPWVFLPLLAWGSSSYRGPVARRPGLGVVSGWA